jgi:hypothetical protein
MTNANVASDAPSTKGATSPLLPEAEEEALLADAVACGEAVPPTFDSKVSRLMDE